MKIDRYQPVQQSYTNYTNSVKSNPAASTSNGQSNDKVEISDQARKLQGSSQLDEARNSRVDRLKNEVQSGTYHVSAEDIAAKMYAYWNK
ncbi:MAG: flagellar biosynthesis anti-sigma factor FlgM [Sporolactobacillus sp.]